MLVYNPAMPYPSQIDREKVLQAASQKLEKTGEIGLRLLAKDLGVQAPSLYRYFKSQGELEKAVAVEGYRRLGGELQKSVEKAVSYASLARAYRKFALENPRLYHLMHDPDVVLDRRDEVVSYLLEPVARGFRMDPNDKKGRDKFVLTLRTLRSFLHGFVSLEMAGHFILGGDVDKSFEAGLSLVTDTLPKPGPGNK